MVLPDLQITHYVVYGMVDVSLLHSYVSTMNMNMNMMMNVMTISLPFLPDIQYKPCRMDRS